MLSSTHRIHRQQKFIYTLLRLINSRIKQTLVSLFSIHDAIGFYTNNICAGRLINSLQCTSTMDIRLQITNNLEDILDFHQ